jgi:hypothetical protein
LTYGPRGANPDLDDPGDSIALLDSEGDGDLDLASLHGLHLNDGTGAFTESETFPEQGQLVDVDGDGDFDLFRMHEADFEDYYRDGFDGFSIRLNDGDIFGPRVAFLTGVRPVRFAAFLHLDNDGRPDLVLGMRSSIAAFLNDGLPYLQGDQDRNGVLDVCEMFHRGDVDSSGILNLTDPVRLLNHLFLGMQELSCLDAADANNDGALDISDGVYILGYLMLGGPPPPSPGPATDACGTDPEGGDLGCTSYTGCADLES